MHSFLDVGQVEGVLVENQADRLVAVPKMLVPRTAVLLFLVILLGTLASFNLPAEGVLVILGVDELMDMARTAVNVIGNCLATAVIARWGGELGKAQPSPAVLQGAEQWDL